MEMLNKFLAHLSSIWNVAPKEIKAITISKGTGKYNLVTITTTQICFHSANYRPNMPVCQTIDLDDYTINELVSTINNMGYTASLTSEAISYSYGSIKAFALTESANMSLENGVTLKAFTATLWQLLYPIARAVHEWSANMDNSIPQMYANITTGSWLDYWASFFNVQRTSSQNDETVRKNMFMNLADIKTNNIALAELVALITKSKVSVTDISPGLFVVNIDPSYMSTASTVYETIDKARGGGINYYLNYTGVYNSEAITKPTDTFSSAVIAMTLEELEPFKMVQINPSLTLKRDSIGTSGATMQAVANPCRMTDTCTMSFSENSVVTQTIIM